MRQRASASPARTRGPRDGSSPRRSTRYERSIAFRRPPRLPSPENAPPTGGDDAGSERSCSSRRLSTPSAKGPLSRCPRLRARGVRPKNCLSPEERRSPRGRQPRGKGAHRDAGRLGERTLRAACFLPRHRHTPPPRRSLSVDPRPTRSRLARAGPGRRLAGRERQYELSSHRWAADDRCRVPAPFVVHSRTLVGFNSSAIVSGLELLPEERR